MYFIIAHLQVIFADVGCGRRPEVGVPVELDEHQPLPALPRPDTQHPHPYRPTTAAAATITTPGGAATKAATATVATTSTITISDTTSCQR